MKKFLSLALLILSQSTYAYFCPTNYSQINEGDTIDQVTAVCGAPDAQKTTTEDTKVPHEWTYYVNQPYVAGRTQPQQVTTIKMTVALSAEGKVSNISLNGQSIQGTPVCGGPIQVGMTEKQLKSICGEPGYINKGELAEGQPKQIQTTVYQYNSNPPITLIFTDGKLSGRK